MACSIKVVFMLACLASTTNALAQRYSLTLLDSAIPGSTERCAALGISGNGLVVAGTDTAPFSIPLDIDAFLSVFSDGSCAL